VDQQPHSFGESKVIHKVIVQFGKEEVKLDFQENNLKYIETPNHRRKAEEYSYKRFFVPPRRDKKPQFPQGIFSKNNFPFLSVIVITLSKLFREAINVNYT